MTTSRSKTAKAPKKPVEKLIWRETYVRKEMTTTDPKYLPVLKDIPKRFTVIEMQTLAAGVVYRDGKRLEYQEIRVYLEEKT